MHQRPGKSRAGLCHLISTMACCGLLLMTGCRGNGEKKIGKDTDPLFGIPEAPPPAPEGISSSKKDEKKPFPALSDPGGSGSTAALAAGLDLEKDKRDLRIGDSPKGRARLSEPKGEWRDPEAGGVTLKRPEPVERDAKRAHPPPPSNNVALAGGVTSNIVSVDQGLLQLRRRGALTSLDTVAGGMVRFRAAVPRRDSPGNRQYYEFRAPDALTAVRSVLAQIEKAELEE